MKPHPSCNSLVFTLLLAAIFQPSNLASAQTADSAGRKPIASFRGECKSSNGSPRPGIHLVLLTPGRTQREKDGASGEIRTLKHLFLRQAAIPIRARWHSGAQGRI